MMKHFLLPVLLVASVSLAQAPQAPRVAAIDQAVEPFVKSEIPGIVTLVADKEKVLHLSAIGMADVNSKRPMQTDSIFWIASMTKPIVGTAIMMLQEEGKLSVDDPIGKYIPELKELKTADGKSYQITIRQILSHTSGMSEPTAEEAKAAKTLAELVPAFKKPLKFEPGSKWSYCQSGINTAGRIVEVASGMQLPEFLEKRIFGPLGMKDTTFYPTKAQMARVVVPCRKEKDGTLVSAPQHFLLGSDPTARDRYPAANGGLVSTASDYARFLQMVLRGGELDGQRIIKPETIKLMTTICTGELKTGFTPGNGWGIGWCVVREPQGVTGMLSAGTCGHGGAYGTQGWLDPVKGRVMVIMIQRANIGNSDGSELRKAFQEAAVAVGGRQ